MIRSPLWSVRRPKTGTALVGVVLVGAAALLGACSSGGDGDGAATEATTTTAARGAATTDPAIRIVPAPGRLTVGGNALPFGAPDFQVSSFLERALGEPTEEEPDQACDAGELDVIRWPSLTVYVGDEGFAGWYTDDDAHTTDQGIAVGASASELQAAYPAGATTESTLGTEFFFDAGEDKGLSALLEDGTVTTLWSGATCIAR